MQEHCKAAAAQQEGRRRGSSVVKRSTLPLLQQGAGAGPSRALPGVGSTASGAPLPPASSHHTEPPLADGRWRSSPIDPASRGMAPAPGELDGAMGATAAEGQWQGAAGTPARAAAAAAQPGISAHLAASAGAPRDAAEVPLGAAGEEAGACSVAACVAEEGYGGAAGGRLMHALDQEAEEEAEQRLEGGMAADPPALHQLGCLAAGAGRVAGARQHALVPTRHGAGNG